MPAGPDSDEAARSDASSPVFRPLSPDPVVITSLTLTDFRSYQTAALAVRPGSTVFYGPNGAGKTNLLEALSLFTPGKGLRTATASEMGRREPGEAGGRPWAVTLTLADPLPGDEDEEPVRLGTGVPPGSSRRMVRINGETAQPGRLLDYLRPVWATPEQDRLFSDARAARLKFFDRLVFAAQPSHANTVSVYERTLRERLRLLTEGAEGRAADPAWLDALEARLSEAGAQAVMARASALLALQAGIDARSDRPFPQADLDLDGPAERMAARGEDEGAIATAIRSGLTASRVRDTASGRSLFGPHRTDLTALHRQKNRPAAEGSSGEQKALVLNLILAQITRLRTESERTIAPPILLLDEAPAHLDGDRRAALFDEIETLKTTLGLQAFMTGTERTLFDGLNGRAAFVRVEGGGLVSDD